MPELMYDQFQLINKKQLNNDDISALTKLYVPLMGIDSYALYLSLTSYQENIIYNFRSLLDILNFHNIKKLTSALYKLEAMGLVKTYVNKKTDYILEMMRPMSIIEFFCETPLVSLLESQIGKDAVKALVSTIVVPAKEYKDITKSFDEVFAIKTEKEFLKFAQLAKGNLVIHNKAFNYPLFKMLFQESFIDEKVLNDPSFESNILKVAFIYQLDENDMKDAVIRSLDMDKSLDYDSLSKNARKIYRIKNDTKTPRVITKANDDYLNSIQDDDTFAFVNYLENVSPKELLEALSGIRASLAEIKLSEQLINNTGLSIGVINFMIFLVVQEKNGEIPAYNYFEKIANTWARAKVTNIKEAYGLCYET